MFAHPEGMTSVVASELFLSAVDMHWHSERKIVRMYQQKFTVEGIARDMSLTRDQVVRVLVKRGAVNVGRSEMLIATGKR